MINEDIEKIKKNNEELLEIINNSWDGIGIIDSNSKLIYVNNAFMPILGFQKNELIKHQLISFMENKYIDSFLELLKPIEKDKKYKAEIDIACIRKDQQKVYLKITISSMINKNLFVINTKDITSSISDEQIIDDYVVSMHTDLHGHILKVSKAFLDLFDFTKEDIIAKHFSKIIHKDINPIVIENINKSLQTYQESDGKIKVKNKRNKAIWLNFKAKAIFNKYGDITAYTYLFFDITNEVTLNDEKDILNKQVEVSKEEILQKNRLLQEQSKLSIMSETLRRLSHEWRQPLNFISIQAQKLELTYAMGETPSNEDIIDSLNKIKNEATNLSNTIENFQNFLRPKKDKDKLVLKELFSELLNKFKKSNKNIELNISQDNQLTFFSYKQDFELLFNNILKNSVENIEKNSILNSKIDIMSHFENGRLYINFIDNAGGIEDSIINKVFEPYFSTKEEKNGVGLGLYITKMIVNLHLNGIITAISSNNTTTIKISIPIEEEDFIK
ncbi:hypothetical protein CP965_02545 [Halarcobacter mediterraneus]|uniref:histidine kinase n=1 Tax=Halarcobacter mediterraneus TaxID=2023153 RepID=A0A4Q1AVY5_9BACT|nr:PAS domain-containing sensor histidine kinase [Halarcobacter mediterraneus]RXK14344.1 hypothetical protein CP965_02545 [Halarcobacter mediterraneus]